MKPPEISTLICSRNHGKYLNDAIRSVEAQTFKPTELIVINDGSDDNTQDLIDRRGYDIPIVIKVKHEKTIGNIRSYNEGIDRARKQFFHLMAADDVLCDRHFYEESTGILLKNEEVAYCATGLQWMKEDKTLLPEQALPPVNGIISPQTGLELMDRFGNFTNGGGVLIRRALQPYYDPRATYSADFLCWITVLGQGHKAYYFQKPGYLYRRHGNQMTSVLAASNEERALCAQAIKEALANQRKTFTGLEKSINLRS